MMSTVEISVEPDTIAPKVAVGPQLALPVPSMPFLAVRVTLFVPNAWQGDIVLLLDSLLQLETATPATFVLQVQRAKDLPWVSVQLVTRVSQALQWRWHV